MRAARRARLLHTVVLACGAQLLSYLVTGTGLWGRARGLWGRAKTPSGGRARTRHDQAAGEAILSPPHDPIDEASWESFPASDSPALFVERK